VQGLSFAKIHKHLPNTNEVRDLIMDGGPTITYLAVALDIIERICEELVDQQGRFAAVANELDFVRSCLVAGHAISLLPCKLSEGAVTGTDAKEACNLVLHRSLSLSSAVEDESVASGAISPKSPRRLADCWQDASPRSGCSKKMGISTAQMRRWPLSEVTLADAAKLTNLLAGFNGWDFDVFRLNALTKERALQFAGWYALDLSGVRQELELAPKTVRAFLQAVEPAYRRGMPYHCNIHAADVTQTVHAMIVDMEFNRYVNAPDTLAIIFSALIHDVGHDGFTNSFHIHIQDELAITYNDRNVQENYHLATTFKLMSRMPGTNIFEGMPREQVTSLRKMAIEMVLGTDMVHHFEKLGEFSNHVSNCGNEPEDWQSDASAMTSLRCTVLHCADISNPSKISYVSIEWSRRILMEFFNQGDVERDLKLQVSPMCDRYTVDIPQSQLGFMKFIVQPTFQAVGNFMPRVHDTCLEQVAKMMKYWEEQDNERCAHWLAVGPQAASKHFHS